MKDGESESTRKVRSDKKHSIAPYIPDVFRIWIYRIARHLELPEGEIGASLINIAINDEECIRFFQPYFKRNYSHGNQLFFGNDFAASIDAYIEILGKRDRFKVRVRNSLYERLSEFQIALKTPYLAHATHAVLRYALHTRGIVKQIAPSFDYESMFTNAPIPRPHNKITVAELAFPKKSDTHKDRDKKQSLPSIPNLEIIEHKSNTIDIAPPEQEKKSVWSVLS